MPGSSSPSPAAIVNFPTSGAGAPEGRRRARADPRRRLSGRRTRSGPRRSLLSSRGARRFRRRTTLRRKLRRATARSDGVRSSKSAHRLAHRGHVVGRREPEDFFSGPAPELASHAMGERRNGRHPDAELARDALVREPLDHEPGHLALGLAERSRCLPRPPPPAAQADDGGELGRQARQRSMFDPGETDPAGLWRRQNDATAVWCVRNDREHILRAVLLERPAEFLGPWRSVEKRHRVGGTRPMRSRADRAGVARAPGRDARPKPGRRVQTRERSEADARPLDDVRVHPQAEPESRSGWALAQRARTQDSSGTSSCCAVARSKERGRGHQV